MKSFEVSSSPVRPAKFLPRKQWIVVGSDDFFIRIFNYNTMEKVRAFEAHNDFIRAFAIHPTMSYLLSSSDDYSIKIWDWEKNWECTKLEGHTHFVMGLCINPKDLNSFASASLDKSIKVCLWLLYDTYRFGVSPHLESHFIVCLDMTQVSMLLAIAQVVISLIWWLIQAALSQLQNQAS